jgi:hypothetical protein
VKNLAKNEEGGISLETRKRLQGKLPSFLDLIAEKLNRPLGEVDAVFAKVPGYVCQVRRQREADSITQVQVMYDLHSKAAELAEPMGEKTSDLKQFFLTLYYQPQGAYIAPSAVISGSSSRSLAAVA